MKRLARNILGAITWLWAIYTLIAVGRYGGAVLFDLSTTSRIMGVRNGSEISSAIGLTWHGLPGAILVVLELALVIAALYCSLKHHTWKRRFSGTVLVLWALLWLGNSIWMETMTGWNHATNTTLQAVCTGVVIAWAALRWGKISR